MLNVLSSLQNIQIGYFKVYYDGGIELNFQPLHCWVSYTNLWNLCLGAIFGRHKLYHVFLKMKHFLIVAAFIYTALTLHSFMTVPRKWRRHMTLMHNFLADLLCRVHKHSSDFISQRFHNTGVTKILHFFEYSNSNVLFCMADCFFQLS